MTNKEYIQATTSKIGLTDSDIEIILIKAGLKADDDVNSDDCDLALYNRFSIVLSGTLQNVSEGSYSISWNMEALKFFYATLCNEIGKDNVLKPKVRNKSNIW